MDRCRPETLLNHSNIKITRQRLTVLGLIVSIDSSFSANDLHEALKGRLDIVTIYRTLQLLCERKILREVMNCDDRQYYELSCEHNPVHPHFYCNLCRKIYCFKAVRTGLPARNIVPEKNFIIQEAVLQYNGICPSCRG